MFLVGNSNACAHTVCFYGIACNYAYILIKQVVFILHDNSNL